MMRPCRAGGFSLAWVTFATAALTVFFGLVGYQTVFTQRNPISVQSAQATAYRMADVTVIEYDRQFTVTETFLGRVSRVVECDGVRTFDIPTISRPFTVGAYNTSRTFSVPFRYPPGASCILRTLVEYRPAFSLRDHLFEVDGVRFTVVAPPKEGVCK